MDWHSCSITHFHSLLICAYQFNRLTAISDSFLCTYIVHCVQTIRIMPTAAERYNFAEVETDGKKYIQEFVKFCKVNDVAGLTQETVVKAGNKDVLGANLVRALQLIERQHNLILNQRVHIESYKSDIIKMQEQVITLQERIITAQTVSKQYKADIVNTVQNEVSKSVCKSFSEVVESGTVNSSSAVISPISQETIKTVAKQVVVEEELCRNIMVFGLKEEENEELQKKIGEVFESLDEKPRIEASRLGKKSGTGVRPVKVRLSTSSAVQQILQKSRNLRKIKQFEKVFLSPDRTLEQRAQRKELVKELKKKSETEPGKTFYIRRGQICSTDKN